MARSNVTPDVMTDFCNINPLSLHSTGVFAGFGPGAEYADMAAYARTRQVSTAWNRLFGPVVATGLMANFVYRPGHRQLARLLGDAPMLAWLQRMDLAGWNRVPAPAGIDPVAATLAASCKAASAGHEGLGHAMIVSLVESIAVPVQRSTSVLDRIAKCFVWATDDKVLSGAPLRVLVRIAKYATAGAHTPSLPMLDLLLALLNATAPDVFVPNKAKHITLPAAIYNPRCADSPRKVTTAELKVRTYVMKIVTNAAVRGRLEVVQALCARFDLCAVKCPLPHRSLTTCVRRGYLGAVAWATASGYYCRVGKTCAARGEGRLAILAEVEASDRYDNYASLAYVLAAKRCKCGWEGRADAHGVLQMRGWGFVLNPAYAPRRLYDWALETRDQAVLHLVRWAYLYQGLGGNYNTYTPPAGSIRAACLAGRTDVVGWIYAMCRVPMDGAELIRDEFLAANVRGDLTTALTLAVLGLVQYPEALVAMRDAVTRKNTAAAAILIERYGILPADARMLRLLYTTVGN